jgi:amino acid adenylation domain-containing protein
MNYHGRVDQESIGGWRLSSDAHGPDRSPRQQREYDIEMNALVSGGHLRLSLTFSRNLHDQADVADLARRVEAQLTATVAQAGVDDVLPLSPTQHGLLFHSLFEDTADAYFNQLTCVLSGPLDVPVFRDAWQRVGARHAALRASFHWHGVERPIQVVHSQVDIPWLVEDWSDASEDDKARRWAELGADDRRRPFDVSTAPLMRCALARMDGETWRFRWSQHHLLLDGWSASIVLGDVLAAYDALVSGRPPDRRPPPPFRNYIDWLDRRDDAASARFWRERLAGFDTPTPLVLGQPEMEGRVQPARYAEAETVLADDLGARLVALAAVHRVTLNTLFQGVWALLLARHSGASDVVFGSIASGRPPELAGSDAMVGLFINTVPVRARIDPDRLVFEWLRDLQEAQSGAEVHSYSPLADVQRESEIPRGVPLFDSILIFENFPVAAPAATRALAIADVRAFEPNNYPVTFVVTPGRSIALKIMFDEGRLDRATIDRTLGHVRTLLSGIAGGPDARVGALPLLTAAEREQLDAWNRTARPAARDETVPHLIQARARIAPASVALICEDRDVTYGDLDRQANQLARVLGDTARRGAAPRTGRAAETSETGDHAPRIVVLLRRSELVPETVLAVWRCGAVYVPVDPEYPAARIHTIIANARPALVIVETAGGAGVAAAREAAERHGATLVVLDEICAARAAQPGEPLAARSDASALAYIIYTSGSTGMPKGAMVEHAGFLNHVRSMIDDLAIDAGSVVAQTASLGFDISMWQLFAALVAGGTTAIYPEALVHRPDALAARFQADRVTVAQFVPSYLNVFLDAIAGATADGAAATRLPTLTHMVTIGEALTPAAIARWFARFPDIPLMNAYGPTEASDSVAHADFTGPVGGALVPIGRPIQNIRLYVVNALMRRCPIGVKGEICIAGIGVGRGYLFDEERTRQAFLPDPFRADGQRMYRTGDVGCYRADGMLLFFGRRDHQVKIRGHRVELGEIESALAAIDEVRDAAAVIHERGGGDRVLAAYVTARSGAALHAADVTARLREHLPHHAVPDVVHVLDDMPVMPNGKIDRRALAARDVIAPGAPAPAEPGTGTERALARIWADALGRDRIGLDQSFFDLGGHSLKAIQIVSRVARDCGADIGVGDLFEHATIRRLAPVVDAASAGRTSFLLGPVATPDQDTYDVSATQLRIWLACRTAHGSASYNMAGAFWLDGAVDDSALTLAIDALVARHEALRTVFEVREGALRQRVLRTDRVGGLCVHADLRAQPLEEDALDRLIQEKIATPFDLANGPLFAVDVLRVADDRRLLLVRLHHLVGDAGSIRVILKEAGELYAAFRHGEAASPLAPLAIQYRDFVIWQRSRSVDEARSRRYWLSLLGGPLPRTGFPPDAAGSEPVTGGSHVVRCDLDAALSARVRELAARHGATLFSVLVSAVYALVYRYRGHEDLIIGSTISRRDHPLLESQVGCYIDMLVLRGRAAGSDSAADLLERTARVCRDALAHRDYAFDSLLADLNVTTAAGKSPVFDVLVDYTPVPAAVRDPAAVAGFDVSEYEPRAEAAHYESMFVLGDAENGAGLSVQLVFKADVFGAATVDLIGARLRTIFAWLADDGARTLGDVELTSAPVPPRRRLRVVLNTS